MIRTIRARCDRGAALTLASFAAAALACATTLRAQEPPAPPPSRDPRSHALLDYDCQSELSRRRVTLFANGTLRLREGTPGQEQVRLVELHSEDVAFYLQAMREVDATESDTASEEPTGDWIDKCTLVIDLPEGELTTYRFGPHGTLSPALSHLVQLSRQLGERVQAAGQGKRHLPIRYKPKRGDVLERADGLQFRVAGLTDDGKGVELEGVDTPYVFYTPLDSLTQEFVALVDTEERDQR